MSDVLRFHVMRYYRPAQRGGGVVQDGWEMTDTLTGARQRFTSKGEAFDRRARIQATEAEIRQRRDEVKWWNADLEFRTHLPLVEVYLYGEDGEKLRFKWAGAPALVERAYGPKRVSEWLQAMGLGDVPRLPSQ